MSSPGNHRHVPYKAKNFFGQMQMFYPMLVKRTSQKLNNLKSNAISYTKCSESWSSRPSTDSTNVQVQRVKSWTQWSQVIPKRTKFLTKDTNSMAHRLFLPLKQLHLSTFLQALPPSSCSLPVALNSHNFTTCLLEYPGRSYKVPGWGAGEKAQR